MKHVYSLMSSVAFISGAVAVAIDKPLNGICLLLSAILLQLYASEAAAPK